MFLMDFLSSFKPTIVVILLLLSLILTFFLALWVNRFFTKESLSKAGPFVSLKNFFSLFPLVSANKKLMDSAMRQSFKEASDSLSLYGDNRHFHYRLPCYLMLGPSGSGKKSLLENLNIPLPLEHSSRKDKACQFHFFDEGTIINLEGSLLLEKKELQSKENEWSLFLQLLLNMRPDNPLDGVILCISAKELLELDTQTLAIRASAIREKLVNLKLSLGVKFPLYIMVTQTDHVTGFSHFCHSIPPSKRDDIFGWSMPYALQTPYEEKWINEIFDHLLGDIICIQQNIFLQDETSSSRDGLMLFPHEFTKLKEPLDIYLKNIFQKSALQETSFFRGLYFVGNGNLDFKAHQENLFKQSFEKTLAPFLSANQGNAALEVTNFAIEEAHVSQKQIIYFVTALFKDKIFPEKGLSIPFKNTLFSKQRHTRFFQTSTLVLVVLGTLSLSRSYMYLKTTSREMFPKLDKIGHVIQRAFTQTRYHVRDHTFFQKQARDLLPSIIALQSQSLHSWAIPFSWLSPLDSKIQEVIELAYEHVIFKAIAQKIISNATLLIEGKNTNRKHFAHTSHTPLATLSFAHFYEYVRKLSHYQELANRYNNLKNSGDFDDFKFLVEELFHYTIDHPLTSPAFLKSAYNTESVGFYMLEKKAQKQFRHLKSIFLRDSFQINALAPELEELSRHIQRFAFATQRSYSVFDLKQLAESLSNSISLFSSPRMQWLSQSTFEPGPLYHTLIQHTALLSFLSLEDADQLKHDCQQAFNRLKGFMLGYSLPFVGRFFVFKDQLFHITPSILNLQGLLNLLLAQRFMNPPQENQKLNDVQENQSVKWNTHAISEASLLIQKFESFFEERTAAMPEKIKIILKKVALDALKRSVQNQITQSQEVVSFEWQASNVAPEEAYIAEVQTIRRILPKIAPLLMKLKAMGFEQIYSDLRKVLHKQALTLLERINAIYESESPYEPRVDVVSRWQGSPYHIFAAFGASSIEDLYKYLALQRTRLRYLAKEFTEPALNMLKILYVDDASSMPYLFLKWSDILTQLEAYAQQVPNTLKMLENFIATTLPELTIEGCPIILQVARSPEGIDYFLNRINAIRRVFSEQCSKMNQRASLASYKRLENFFNTHLSGRYPFVPKDFENPEDASLDEVKAFFSLFDKEGPYAKEMLLKERFKNPHYQKALLFIKQVERIRPLFRSLTANASARNLASVPLEISFRANQKFEKNASHLLSWQLMVGENTLNSRIKNTKTWWHYGTPLKVHFRWARGSLYRPTPSPHMPHMTIHPLQATFAYQGSWSLIKMLQSHKTHTESNEPLLLKFQVPMTEKERMITSPCTQNMLPQPESSELLIFMTLKLADNLPGSSLEVPTVFPFIAPTLSKLEKIENTSKKPKKHDLKEPSNERHLCPLPKLPAS